MRPGGIACTLFGRHHPRPTAAVAVVVVVILVLVVFNVCAVSAKIH